MNNKHFNKINKKLYDLGWRYNEDLGYYSKGNRYVEIADVPFIDIYAWNNGKDGSYLTIDEFVVFGKLFKKLKRTVKGKPEK